MHKLLLLATLALQVVLVYSQIYSLSIPPGQWTGIPTSGPSLSESSVVQLETTELHGNITNFYVYGGRKVDGTVTDEFWAYNSTNNQWYAFPSSGVLTSRADHTAVELETPVQLTNLSSTQGNTTTYFNQTVYRKGMLVFGGFGVAGTPLNDMLLFRGLHNQTWTTYSSGANLTQLEAAGRWPQPRYGHCALTVRDQYNISGQSMWVFGGGDRFNQPLNDLWAYSFDSGNWTRVVGAAGSATPRARSHMSCNAPVGDCIYVFGGKHPTTNLINDFMDRFCFSTGRWEQLTPSLNTGLVDPPLRRWGHTAVNVNKRVLIFGGYEGTFPTDFLQDFWSYDVTLNKWIVPTMLGTPPSVRRSHMAAWLDSTQRLYVFGGRDRYFTLSDLTTSSYAPILCPGGFFTTDGDSSCGNCTRGSFSSPGAYNCTFCAPGTYSEVLGSSVCLDCPAGFYNTKTGSTIITDCDPCAPGSFSTVLGATTVLTCTSCPRGKYQANSGRSLCNNCTAGTASALFGSASSTTCNPCQAGLFSPAPASTSCTPCPKGTFTGVAGLSVCQDCLPGTWSIGFASSCTGCIVGKYNPNSGSTTANDCLFCDKGTYADVPGLGVCRNCSRGSWGNSTGQTTALDCYKCNLGQYSDVEAATSPSTCVDCLPGTYADTLGQGTCTLCPNGTYSATVGATTAQTCLNCTAGQFNDAPGRSTPCLACPSGTWSFAGFSYCVTCSGGSFLPTGGTSIEDCTGCEPMFFGLPNQASCSPCANGTYSMQGWSSCSRCDGTDSKYGGSLVSNPHFDFQGSWVASPQFSYISGGYTNVSNDFPFAARLVSDNTTFFQAGAAQTVTLDQPNAIDLRIAGYSRAFNVSGSPDSNYAIVMDVLYQDLTSASNVAAAVFNTGTHDYEYAFADFTVTKRIKSVDIRIQLKVHSGEAYFDDIFLVTKPTTACFCEGGSYWAGEFNNTDCERCPAGSYCRAGIITTCPYQQLPTIFSFGGASACSPCLTGWRCQNGIALPCTPYREYLESSNNTCMSCPDGYECIQGVRKACRAGTRSQFGGRCKLCEPGLYQPSSTTATCLTCPAGKTSGYSRTFCYDCQAGEFSNAGGVCTSCPVGQYSGVDGSPGCQNCPQGKYGNIKALSACFDCPYGTNTAGTGATDISACV